MYGSVTKATDQAVSDVDLMIISDSFTYREASGALDRVTRLDRNMTSPFLSDDHSCGVPVVRGWHKRTRPHLHISAMRVR